MVQHHYIVVASQYVNLPKSFLIEDSPRSTAGSHNVAKSETREEAGELRGVGPNLSPLKWTNLRSAGR